MDKNIPRKITYMVIFHTQNYLITPSLLLGLTFLFSLAASSYGVFSPFNILLLSLDCVAASYSCSWICEIELCRITYVIIDLLNVDQVYSSFASDVVLLFMQPKFPFISLVMLHTWGLSSPWQLLLFCPFLMVCS